MDKTDKKIKEALMNSINNVLNEEIDMVLNEGIDIDTTNRIVSFNNAHQA